jgi:hypothetical protein
MRPPSKPCLGIVLFSYNSSPPPPHLPFGLAAPPWSPPSTSHSWSASSAPPGWPIVSRRTWLERWWLWPVPAHAHIWSQYKIRGISRQDGMREDSLSREKERRRGWRTCICLSDVDGWYVPLRLWRLRSGDRSHCCCRQRLLPVICRGCLRVSLGEEGQRMVRPPRCRRLGLDRGKGRLCWRISSRGFPWLHRGGGDNLCRVRGCGGSCTVLKGCGREERVTSHSEG